MHAYIQAYIQTSIHLITFTSHNITSHHITYSSYMHYMYIFYMHIHTHMYACMHACTLIKCINMHYIHTVHALLRCPSLCPGTPMPSHACSLQASCSKLGLACQPAFSCATEVLPKPLECIACSTAAPLFMQMLH